MEIDNDSDYMEQGGGPNITTAESVLCLAQVKLYAVNNLNSDLFKEVYSLRNSVSLEASIRELLFIVSLYKISNKVLNYE